MRTTIEQSGTTSPLNAFASLRYFGRGVLSFVRLFIKTLSSGIIKIERIVWRFVKRLFDFLASAVMLILLLPVFIVVAVLIKLDDGGPIFFRQVRTGRKGKTFKIVKFRTCKVDNDVRDAKSADAHTKIGKILRKTSIDELPQLINVLKGEMSFIGPRPWITEYWDNMTDEQRGRTNVLPGMTGLAQVKGRNAISIFDKINYDLEYVNHYGLREDAKVFALTVKTLIGSGKAEDGSASVADAGKATIHGELEQLRAQHEA